MKKSNRPKWAKPLSPSQWRHLQEGQDKNTPTLTGLKQDANTCRDCKSILVMLEQSEDKMKTTINEKLTQAILNGEIDCPTELVMRGSYGCDPACGDSDELAQATLVSRFCESGGDCAHYNWLEVAPARVNTRGRIYLKAKLVEWFSNEDADLFLPILIAEVEKAYNARGEHKHIGMVEVPLRAGMFGEGGAK